MNEFKLEENLMIIDVKTASFLLSQDNGSDVLALYIFYYKTAKLQRTNQIRATELFCRTGLKWGVRRFRTAQSILTNLDLISIIKSGDKWYIRVGYIKNNSAKSSLVENEPNSAKKQLDASGTQMLSKNKILNAYTSTNVEDDVRTKRPPSCPLLTNQPLKDKYPKGHTECVEYINSFHFINKAKQFKFLHQMLRAGMDFQDIDKILSRIEKKPYYQENGYDMATVASEAERRFNASRT